MSYGISSYGISSYGGSSFTIIDHIPFDNAVGIDRNPTVSFTLLSEGSPIALSSINLTLNSIAMITNGIINPIATGTINSSDPNAVTVDITVSSAFAPLAVVSVQIDVLNNDNSGPSNGASWQFTVGNGVTQFTTYVVRAFERIFKVAS